MNSLGFISIMNRPTPWLDSPVNSIVLTVSIILLLLNLRNFITILPDVISCILRARPNISLEHNIHTSANRNVSAWALFPVFCLALDRYKLYSPEFLAGFQDGLSLLVTALSVLAILVSRYLFYPLHPERLRDDEKKAVHNVLFTCFVGLVPIMVLTIVFCLFLGTPDHSVKMALLYEIVVMYMVSIIRSAQFLSSQCSTISTILYLCALELIPAALAVVSALRF